MKEHLHNSLRALFLSLAVLLSLPMLAVEVEIDGINYELVAKIKEATVISGWYSGEVVIPESVEHEGTTYSVTSIGDEAFYECSGLTSVTIPNSVTSIGESAFYNCDALTSVTIPNSVTRIGDEAFAYCYGLTSVTIPNSVTRIEDYAFCGCTRLISVNIPNSVTSIGSYAFAYCYGLTSVTIPNSVTSIGYHAFYKCSGLTSVTIGNSVKSIGRNAFEGCSGLKSVHILDIAAWCNIEFGDNPLYYAHHLYLNGEEVKDLVIPNSVTSIREGAFSNCSALTSVTIPNSVTSIRVVAFSGCSDLTSVTIGSGVEEIGYSAFANCPELLDVYCYAENVPYTKSDAFDGSYPEYVTLHVPDGSIDSYKAKTPWSGFGKIVALTEEETGIDEVKGENGKVKTAVYDLSGRRVQKAQKGIFIQNGKLMVK